MTDDLTGKGCRKRRMEQRLTAILPCNGLDTAQGFFERLGFSLDASAVTVTYVLPRSSTERQSAT
jgi:hypothetical protein